MRDSASHQRRTAWALALAAVLATTHAAAAEQVVAQKGKAFSVKKLKVKVGDSVKFVLSNTSDPNAITLTFLGVILDKDHVKGSVDFGGMGSATFAGTRQRAP